MFFLAFIFMLLSTPYFQVEHLSSFTIFPVLTRMIFSFTQENVEKRANGMEQDKYNTTPLPPIRRPFYSSSSTTICLYILQQQQPTHWYNNYNNNITLLYQTIFYGSDDETDVTKVFKMCLLSILQTIYRTRLVDYEVVVALLLQILFILARPSSCGFFLSLVCPVCCVLLLLFIQYS